MFQKILSVSVSSVLFSSLLFSHASFAETPTKKLKPLAEKQHKLSENIELLDKKFSSETSSNNDPSLNSQSQLIHQAAEAAKQAADDLDKAEELSVAKKS